MVNTYECVGWGYDLGLLGYEFGVGVLILGLGRDEGGGVWGLHWHGWGSHGEDSLGWGCEFRAGVEMVVVWGCVGMAVAVVEMMVVVRC